MKTIIYKGIKKPYLYLLRGSERPAWAPVENTIIEIPGMSGGYISETRKKVRVLNLVIGVKLPSGWTFEKVNEDLAEWLVTDQEEELIISDESNRIYYAKIDGTLNIEPLTNHTGMGVLTFLCPDSYKYGVLKSGNFENPTGPVILWNGGTAPTAPIFNITLKQKTTHLDIIGPNDYMRIGRPPGVEVNPVDPRQIVLWDQMNSLTGWVTAQNTDIDGGTVAGTMRTNGYEFSASSYGTGSSWHGPALIKSIGQSLSDFEVEFRLRLMNDEMKTVGRVELYLLDEAKNAVGKLSLKDNHSGMDGNYAELRVGDRTTNRFLISERGEKWQTWLDFDGMLRLSRIGNKWTAYVTKIVNGKHTARRVAEFTDTENKFTRVLSHVAVHIAAYGDIAPAPMAILDLKVYKINDVSEEQIKFIGDAGDVFTFDHKTSAIYRNGELYMKKDFGARFFYLARGENRLVVSPTEVISKVEAEWRDAYL